VERVSHCAYASRDETGESARTHKVRRRTLSYGPFRYRDRSFRRFDLAYERVRLRTLCVRALSPVSSRGGVSAMAYALHCTDILCIYCSRYGERYAVYSGGCSVGTTAIALVNDMSGAFTST